MAAKGIAPDTPLQIPSRKKPRKGKAARAGKKRKNKKAVDGVEKDDAFWDWN